MMMTAEATGCALIRCLGLIEKNEGGGDRLIQKLIRDSRGRTSLVPSTLEVPSDWEMPFVWELSSMGWQSSVHLTSDTPSWQAGLPLWEADTTPWEDEW